MNVYLFPDIINKGSPNLNRQVQTEQHVTEPPPRRRRGNRFPFCQNNCLATISQTFKPAGSQFKDQPKTASPQFPSDYTEYTEKYFLLQGKERPKNMGQGPLTWFTFVTNRNGKILSLVLDVMHDFKLIAVRLCEGRLQWRMREVMSNNYV